MGRIMLLNASPRAPRSNSRQYGERFVRAWKGETVSCSLTRANHLELIQTMESCSDLLLVFPLYADGIPVTLLSFLTTLEAHPPQHKPVVSVLINCGFLEPEQNDVAVEMIRLFCAENGYPFGSVLKIGSGEAILATPFRLLVSRKIKQLAASIRRRRHRTFQVTMPISKAMFLKASAIYWTNYGKRSGVTKEQMATMQIEEQ